MLDLDKTAAGFRPCPIARVAGYIGFATYETAVSGMPGFKSLAKNYSGYNVPKFDDSKTINYPLAINAATAYMYKQFFQMMYQTKFYLLKRILDPSMEKE